MARADSELRALYEALDERRRSRKLSWTAAAREINRGSPGGHGIATSTISALGGKIVAEGDGVLAILLWLGRTPESFIPGFENAEDACFRLRRPAPGQTLRWDTRALHAALDAKRQSRGITWTALGRELGGFTPGMLSNLSKGGRVGFPGVMRLVLWAGQPAATFTICDTDAFIFGPEGVRTR